MAMQKIAQVSQDLVKGDVSKMKNPIEEMKSFNEYFLSNSYDSFKVDKASNGNLLFFTMMYAYYKEDWKSNIPRLNENKYKSLMYRLMKSYRKNYYHT